MAKKAKKIRNGNSLSLEIVNPNAAGIDIADAEMQVCVPPRCCEDNNRKFGSTTAELRKISAWLKECGITMVAMEATGIYWISLFSILQEDGFDVVLTNARDVINMVGQKTDENDAESIMVAHQYGLLKASYQPENEVKRIRTVTRQRASLVEKAAQEVLRVQKALQQMNIKLSVVLSDVVGESGRRIIEAIIGGEHDPKALASLADGRCKSSKAEIAAALEGIWDESLIFVLRQNYEDYKHTCAHIEECDKKLEVMLCLYIAKINHGVLPEFIESGKSKAKGKPQAVKMDVERLANEMWGVNTFAIPGFSDLTVLMLMGELGHAFPLKFRSADAFARWCNLAPNTKISGGKTLSSRVPKKKNKVGLILRKAASSLANAKNELGNFYRRVRSRAGGKGANIATAHKLALIFFNMVSKKEAYDPNKVGLNHEDLLKLKIARYQRELQKLTSQGA